MTLTEDGHALLKYCRSVEGLECAFLSRTSGQKKREVSLTVVGPTSAISSRIVEDCARLYFKYPQLRLNLRSDDQANRIDLFRRAKADLAIVSPEDDIHALKGPIISLIWCGPLGSLTPVLSGMDKGCHIANIAKVIFGSPFAQSTLR